MRARAGRVGGVITAVVLAAATALPSPATAEPSPPFIPPAADALTVVNYYRAVAGLGPVTEDPVLADGARKHSCYMLQNGISHDEVPGKPGYTAEGDAAGNNGNVAVSSAFGTSARSHIELWMTGPFHAIGVLRPQLQRIGYGQCDDTATSPWRSAATLDVLHGLGPSLPRTEPVLFPGNGSTTNLAKFVVETPDPLAFCGWTGPAGLPVIALMPETVGGGANATITGPAGPVQTCTLSDQNTNGTAQAILRGDHAVVAIPRAPLAPGTYTVTVTTAARTVTWSFTVDPAAALGTSAPPAVATPGVSASGFQPLTPVRVVDTREGFGGTRIGAQLQQRIQITGRGGVPAGAPAISANFTVTGTSGPGFLTVWNCSTDRPVVATLNYGAEATVPNAASVPLDASGGICVYSHAATDLVIDVNGYYGASGVGRFTSLQPVRLMETRPEYGGTGRMGAHTTRSLQVGGVGGIPAKPAAVILNVASVDPGAAGFVTVFPCDQPRPLAASLNPVPGDIKPNLVVAPVAADGTVCFYTYADVDLVVDATGFLSGSSPMRFTSTKPFRFTDTRDASRSELNAGTGGRTLTDGQVVVLQIAGTRGVPAGARAVSANIAVTGAQVPGFLTAWPCGDRPNTANVNYGVQTAVSNGAQLPLSASGQLCVYTMTSAHVIVDVNGWWS